jgi:predicted NodU family carbamoyl transferase
LSPRVDLELSPRLDDLGAVAKKARAAIDGGAQVVLRVPVNAHSYRRLPDIVRWVDDRLSGIAGLDFTHDDAHPARTAPDFHAWWVSTRHACEVREVGCLITGELPGAPGPGLRPPRPEPRPEPHPELLTTWPRPLEDEVEAGITALMEGVGTLARFVNLPRLTEAHPKMLAYVRQDPRDMARYERHVASDHLKTLIHASQGVDHALIDGVKRACEALGSEVVVALGEDSKTASALGTFTARVCLGHVRATTYAPVTEQTLSLFLEPQRREAMDALVSDWSRSTPPSTWHPHLSADLWLVDVPDLGVITAGSDPVTIDRFLLEALEVEDPQCPWMADARNAESHWVTHEAVVPGGILPLKAVDRPRPRRSGRPLTILGIASTTLANHAAVVLRDGEIVAAVQEERPRRKKQLGWHPVGEPGVTVVSDATLPLEASWPKRAIQSALDIAGLTLDDVDHHAYNGVPARFFPTYDLRDPTRPPQTLFDGRDFYVPHHLAHAASAFRVSGMKDAFIFTVDGRGERETAGFFVVEEGRIRRVFDVLVNDDSLIGGVYEYLTTILGFGHHGAGSTMGLAPYGEPRFDLSPWLSATGRDDYAIHDRGLDGPFGHLKRKRNGAMTQDHKDLAASAQQALEETVLAFVRDGVDGQPIPRLCLAGGVALNCSMNQRLRTELGVEEIYVQPAANDSGTALGAAAEAHFELTGENLTPMHHAKLGPGYSRAQVEAALNRFGLRYTTPDNLCVEVAKRLVDQQVVAWFDGRLEFGPRALGARSILADPRTQAMQDRVNAHKARQSWRPFGPSVLAGHEADWFLTPFHTPFMLFTLPVRPERRAQIAAVVHVDGTTRPQSVTETDNPTYHALISEFHRLTGVPMVLNTSFNTAFEPIVQSPEDAISSFLQLGVDALAIEGYLVERPRP